MNLSLIIDKEEAYVNFEKEKIVKDWNHETRTVHDIAEVGLPSLFEEVSVSILVLNTKEDIKKLVEVLKKATDDDWRKWLNPGLVITTTVDRRQTKALEKIIQDKNGDVVLSKKNSKDKTQPASVIVDELSIPYPVKQFLKDFAGDDYSTILSVVKTIGALNPKQQQSVTIDDILVRLPQPPGSIPPWEVDKSILAQNATQAIENYRRFTKTSSLLVVLAVVKRKFTLIFHVASLLSFDEKMSLVKISETLGVPNNYPLKLAYQTAKKIGLKKAIRIVEIFGSTESDVKGCAFGNSHVIIESSILQIIEILRK